MTDTNLVAVADFTAYAPEVDVSRYDNTTLSGIIGDASKMVSDYLLYTPIAEDIVSELKEARITSDGDLLIFPNKLPVNSVSSISISKGATDVSINLVDGSGNPKYNIDYSKRKILYPYGEISLTGVPIFTDFYALRGSHFYTKISYNGGWAYASLPGTIKQACFLFIREILSKRYNTSGATQISQGGISLRFAESNGQKSDLVVDAQRLLGPYKRIG